jgi:hypothetical protein
LLSFQNSPRFLCLPNCLARGWEQGVVIAQMTAVILTSMVDILSKKVLIRECQPSFALLLIQECSEALLVQRKHLARFD